MALRTVGQPPLMEIVPAHTDITKLTYVSIICMNKNEIKKLPMKPIDYLHRELRKIWEEEEVEHMIINEDLRRLIPKQYKLKREVNIGLLCNRHIHIRVTQLEDYVHLLSKP